MESIAKLVAAPKEIEIFGKTEKLYPLRFLEWGKLEQWIQSRIIGAAKDSLQNLSQREALIVMKAAFKIAAQISITHCLQTDDDEEGTTYLRSFEGMLRVLHLSLRDSSIREAKPKYSLLELDEKLQGDISLLSMLFLDILDISFPSLKEEEEEEGEEETEEKEEKNSEKND